jgi:hypothetical protein
MMMNMTSSGAKRSMPGGAKATIKSRIKTAAVLLLLGGTALFATGCYDEPGYYGRRNVRAGYYASYGGPGPYYGHDPYGYGYGYGSGIGVGVSSYRSYPGYYRRPYYGRGYGRSGYYRRHDRRRDWDRREERGDRGSWDRRGRRGRDRDRDRAIRRGAERVEEQQDAPPVQP